MKLQSLMLRNSLFVLTLLLALPAFRAVAQSKPDSAAAAQAKPDAAQAPQTQSKPQQGLKPVPRNEDGRELVEEGPDFLQRRQDWFFKPRAFPIGFIPQGARERALQQKALMYQREGRLGVLAAQPGSGFLPPPPSGPTSAWFSVGPQPTSSPSFPPFTSGRVTALAVNPNNPSNVYLGGADGGLWVSTDGGNTWTPLTDNPPDAANIPTVAVGAIAVDPTTCVAGGICTTVYVGTGENNYAGDNVYGEGVLNCTVTAGTPPTAACTQDTTFHTPSPLDDTRGAPMIGALAVNRAAGKNNILLAGVRGRASAIVSGVWCSADKGVTWTRVLPTTLTNGAGDPGSDVAFASDGTAWAALGFPVATAGNGIYRSNAPVTSCSITFTQQTLPSNFTAGNIGRITLALAPSDNTKIYAAIADATNFSATLLGVVLSTNATATTPTWAQFSDPLVNPAQGFCNPQCSYDMPLAVDPANSAVVYAGGGAGDPIIRTTNGTVATATWADVTGAGGSFPHVDTHAFAFAGDGTRLYVGNDGGIWCTGTPATTISWNDLNAPTPVSSTGALNITQFYPGVSIHPSNPGFAMGGTQDNGTQVDQAATASTNPLIWQDSGLPCDGGFTVIDPAIPSTSYGECEYLPGRLLLIAVTFAGDGLIGNGLLATSGIDGTDRGSFIPPLIVDQNHSQTLYFGTCRLWQTTDGANSWIAISPDVTNPSHALDCSSAGGVLSTIAVAPNDSTVIYVGSDSSDIEVTSNGGTTWTSIATTTLPARSVTQVAVDPSTAATAYATFSGFGTCATFCSGPTGHVFKTTNGTATTASWTNISGNLPDIPVNAIVIDPADSTHNTLYIGTDVGGFFTTTGGTTWLPLGAASSMPNAQILSLTLHNPSRTLRAATHGRGVWDLNLGGAAAFSISSISPFSANAGAASITNFTVNGNGFTAGSVVKFALNGTTTSLTTSCATATSCTATIPSAQLASGGSASVTVTNTSPVGTTNALPFTILNPVPVINSISPTTVTAGTTNFSLTINGASIACGGANATSVLFNFSTVPLSNITACTTTSLTVTLPNSDLTITGSFPIDLLTPQPGGGPDTDIVNGLNGPFLTVTNPVPTITTLMPSSATAGGAAFTLTVNGTNFVSSSTVNFAGAPKTTTFVSGTQLTAAILASDIATAGTPAVTVANPTPGGGTSNSVTFTVTVAGSFTVSGGSGTITATAGTTPNTAMIPVTVTPSNGFTGTVTFTCAAAGTSSGALPFGASCPTNPPFTITIPAGTTAAVTQNLTVSLTPPSSSMSASLAPPQRTFYAAGVISSGARKGWWALSAGAGLAALFLLLLPGRKRYRAALGLGLLCVVSFTLGCNNYNNNNNGGPVATTTALSVTPATKNPTSATITITPYSGAAVQGSASLNDLSTGTNTSVSITSGVGTANLSLTGIGTHSLQASYGGSTADAASMSHMLNVTVTGGPQAATITGTSGSITANGTINVTIN